MSDKETLLQKAKQIKVNKKGDRKLGDEEYELGLAWVKGEVTMRQIQTVMGYKNTNSSYTLIAQTFLRYFAEKEWKI